MKPSPKIYAKPWFRCLASVGFRLLRNLDTIYAHTDESNGRGWDDLLKQFELRYQIARDSALHSDPDYITKYFRAELELFAKGFDTESPELGNVLVHTAKEVSPLTDEEMSDAFHQVNLAALQLARKCGTDWGGRHATLRASKLKAIPLNLDVDSAPAKPSTLTTWTTEEAIHVPTGGVRPLLDFVCLKFFLLHEYLSHLFPSWEDGAGLISEGYLFPVGRWWHTAQADFPITSSLVDLDWEDHWLRIPSPQSSRYWREFHSRVDWMESKCPKERLCWILLEMASYEEDGRPGRFQEAFLGFFEILAKRDDCTFIWDILNSPSTDIKEIHGEIRQGLRSKLPANIRKKLGLDDKEK
jgi:hypothetical protein